MQSKVLVLDIETSPVIAYVWGIKEQHLSLSNIKEDPFIMAWAAKWLGDPPNKLVYRDQRNAKNMADDSAILKDLWDLLNQADIVVSQNGEAFDVPRIDARMMLHGFKPYKPFRHHDTYRQLKNKGFVSHKLEYLTEKFCKKYKKLKHGKFPGMSLWHECLKRNKDAWDEMKRYNINDVLSTEELYLNTRGWSTKNAPKVFHDGDERTCKYCGEHKLTKQGVDRTSKKVFQQLQCQACGKWQRGSEVKSEK